MRRTIQKIRVTLAAFARAIAVAYDSIELADGTILDTTLRAALTVPRP